MSYGSKTWGAFAGKGAKEAPKGLCRTDGRENGFLLNFLAKKGPICRFLTATFTAR
ncbi:hypothetical protein GCM10028786_27410 [Flaviaesturariibacter terrae]